VLRQLGDDLVAMERNTLRWLEEWHTLHGSCKAEALKRLLLCVSLSRSGLRDAELADLLGCAPPGAPRCRIHPGGVHESALRSPRPDWVAVYHGCLRFLLRSDQGLVCFRHEALRTIVRRLYPEAECSSARMFLTV
jgi:hypothetical protein